MLRRAVAFGKGLFPIFPPSEEQLVELGEAVRESGHDLRQLELIITVPTPSFTDPKGLLDLKKTMANVPDVVSRGLHDSDPLASMFIDDDNEFEDEHVAVFESAHERLRRTLDELGDPAATPALLPDSARPARSGPCRVGRLAETRGRILRVSATAGR